MPIKLSELQAKTRALSVSFEGETLAVSYYPARFTPTTAARMQDVADAERPSLAMAEALADVLASWEILDEDGKPLPADAEWIVQMPLQLINQIVQALGEDMRPKAENGDGSRATS